MVKYLKKAVAVLTLSLLAVSTNLNPSVVLANDKPYEKHYQADLRSLDIQVKDNQIKVEKKNVPVLEKVNQDKNLKIFTEQMLSNDKFVKDLKKMIENGKTPIAISVAQAEFIKQLDENGNVISSRPMTNKEVAQEKASNFAYAINGPTETRDTLSLYTSLSGTSPTYWAQSNAYWSGIGEMSSGREAIGLTWDSAFAANNNRSTTIKYSVGADETASLEAFDAYKGVAWGFNDGYVADVINIYLQGAYTGTSVTRISGGIARHYFSSEYIHTYSSATWSAGIALDPTKNTGVTINLSPSTSTWKLVAPLQGDF